MTAATRRRARLTRAEAREADVDWSMVAKIFGLARPWRRQLVIFGVAAAGTALLGSAPALVFRSIIDRAVPQRDAGLLAALGLAAAALYLLQSGTRLVQRWAAAEVGSGVTFTMRHRLYDHLQRLPVSFFTASRSGAVMSRLTNDVMGAQRVLTDVVSTVSTNAFTFASTTVVMVLLDWQLALVVLAAVPCFLLPSRYMGRVLQRITRQRMDLVADMNGFLQERLGVGGAMLNHLFGDHGREQAAYEDRARSVRDIGIRTALVAGTFTLATSMFATCSTALVYWFGGWRAITGGLTVGTLVAFGQLATRIYQPVNALTTTRIDLMTAMVSFDRVFEVLDFPNPVVESDDAIDLREARGAIEFDDVWFTHAPPSRATLPSLEDPTSAAASVGAANGSRSATAKPGAGPVLRGVSFVVEPGTTVALVGPTGAGKSTTLSLVPRLADVDAGAVRLDGHDVRALTLRSLRSAIGVVSQDVHLFHDTLANNLRYAKPAATVEDLERACRLARIHDLIAGLPDGYETVAGERGYRLSGGEKQRLAIARMILKDPRVVLLDEATSHLDSGNERLIQEALAEALAGRTTIVVAHRLSTVVAADRIVVLDAGTVVQQGTHAELSAQPGMYRDLCVAQWGANVD